MFNSQNYVPILKWKRAEQNALKALAEEHKKRITPLIQFVMPKQEDHEKLEDVIRKFEEQLPHIPKKLLEVCGSNPLFIDFSLLFTTPLKVKCLNTILRAGRKMGAAFIPVIYLNDDLQIKKAAYTMATENGSGMCLRLICPDFSDFTKFQLNVAGLLSSAGMTEKDIDLLVDIKETGANSDKYVKYFSLSQSIPQLPKWRTFIFASGSFPEDLSKCKLDEENLIPRIDWMSWEKDAGIKKLQRKPAFADYTIQYPIYKEITQFYPPTTSIKYTLDNDWLIMKGQKQRYDKYLASAALLAEDGRFYGENFSDGDKYISEKAKHFKKYIKNPAIKGTGSTETWLRAGINHHLVLVANQVANLS
jgi:hypothetical protein